MFCAGFAGSRCVNRGIWRGWEFSFRELHCVTSQFQGMIWALGVLVLHKWSENFYLYGSGSRGSLAISMIMRPKWNKKRSGE